MNYEYGYNKFGVPYRRKSMRAPHFIITPYVVIRTKERLPWCFRNPKPEILTNENFQPIN